MTNRAVFLDRDNTIIHLPQRGSSDVELIKGAASALASLQGVGFRLIVVTNEPEIANGQLTEDDRDRLHESLAESVKRTTGAVIDRFYYCPFDPVARVAQFAKDHPWRKPHPGMWQRAAEDLSLDLRLSWTIGRSADDIAAGRAAGTRTILLDEKGRESAAAMQAQPDFVAGSLIEAARVIAQQRPIPLDPALEQRKAAAATIVKPRAGRTAPVSQPPTGEASAESSRGARPFVPWTIQPEDGPAAPLVQTPITPQRAEGGPVPVSKPAPAPPQPVVTEVTTPRPVSTPPRAVTPPPPTTPPSGDAPDPSSMRETNALLRQIISELKAQRVDTDDFSIDKVLAGVAQMGAIGCVILGLIVQFAMGQDGVFIQWLAGGIFLQLLVVAMLLLKLLR